MSRPENAQEIGGMGAVGNNNASNKIKHRRTAVESGHYVLQPANYQVAEGGGGTTRCPYK